MNSGRWTFGVTAILAVSLTVPHAAVQQAPVFRSGVDRVAVDFLAVALDGRPVSDLRPEELSLKVDGKPRDIRSLEFIRLSSSSTVTHVESRLPPALAVPAPYGSNAPNEAGRSIILIFHHTSMYPGDERLVRDSAADFVRALSPRDRVALVTFQEGGVLVDLTTDHDRVLKALPTITGHKPKADNGAFGIQNVASDVASASENYAIKNLSSLFDSFSRIDGPKTVVLISGGMPALPDGATAGNRLGAVLADYQDVGRAAAKAGVQLFIIAPHTMGAMTADVHAPASSMDAVMGPGTNSGSGLETLAGATGGAMFQASAGAPKVFERIAVESSGTYLLGFDAETAERNGKTHKISLTVARPGVTIRARPEFLIAKTTPTSPKEIAAAQPLKLVADMKTYRDFPLRTVAYAFRSAPVSNLPRVRVLIVAEPTGGGSIKSAALALIDEKGRIAAQWNAHPDDLASTPLVSSATVPPGTYRARVAAVDSEGRKGTVEYEVSARMQPAGHLSLSGLMLGRIAGKEFAPEITFKDATNVTAYVEAYGVLTTGQKAMVTMELARAADAPALVRVPGSITGTRDRDRFIVTADLPIANLPPGDYVVRAIAAGDGVNGTMIRTLRKQ